MIDFISYVQLSEDINMALNPIQIKLQKEVMSLGYEKTKFSTRDTLLVYVPKSERNIAMDTLEKKLKDSYIDKSGVILRKVSSIGAIGFNNGPYKGYYVGVKPDASKGLTTDEQETLAGIFIACKQQNKQTNYSFEDLQKFGDSMTDSKFKINDLFEKAGKGWLSSSAVIADTLAPYLDGSYRVQQRSGSKFETNISKVANDLLKKANAPINLNKWNPADIWLVKPGLINYNFSQFTSIFELNEFLLEKFNSKEIIGVSLKQVGKSAKVEVFNAEKGGKQVSFESYDLGKTGFVNALNGTLYFTNGSMVIRNFGRPENVSGEINGKHAQGGKVGAGPLFNIIKKYDRSFNTKNAGEIIRMLNKNPEAVYKHLFEQMNKLDPTIARKYTYEKFVEEVSKKSNSINYVISKWQVSDIINSIKKMTNPNKDSFVKDVIGYASSSTELSSVFYKVS